MHGKVQASAVHLGHLDNLERLHWTSLDSTANGKPSVALEVNVDFARCLSAFVDAYVGLTLLNSMAYPTQ